MITFSCQLKIYGAFYILEIKFEAYWVNLVTIEKIDIRQDEAK